MSLENESPEPFRYSRASVSHVSFSHDSNYMATAVSSSLHSGLFTNKGARSLRKVGLTSQSGCDTKRRGKVGEVEGLLRQTGARPQNFQTQGLAVVFLGSRDPGTGCCVSGVPRPRAWLSCFLAPISLYAMLHPHSF